LLHYLILVMGATVALQAVGLNLSGLFAAGAVFAIGLGFAMQNIAENFVSGVILLLERAIKPGDILQVNDQVVRVVQMGIRSTLVRNRNDEDLILPNSNLAQGTVNNLTLDDSLLRIRAPIGVSYESDLRRVIQVLREAAVALEGRDLAQDPIILLTDFGDSSVNFEVSVWITDPWLAPRHLSKLNENIWWALKDADVSIPFPQVDVHLTPPPKAPTDLS